MSLISPSLHFAKYELTSPGSLPITQTLPLADALRKHLLWREGEYNSGELSTIFSGKNDDGKNQVDHAHAFILPIDSNRNGFLDQVLIYSRLPFHIPALVALERIQEERYFRTTSLDLMEISSQIPRAFQKKSRRWRSVTPLLSFRHYKKNAGTKEEWWEEEVDRFCRAQRLPTTVSVSLLSTSLSANILWKEFALRRPSKPENQIPHYVGLEIEFKKPQSFPLCLGEYCHFGMGRFEPCE